MNYYLTLKKQNLNELAENLYLDEKCDWYMALMECCFLAPVKQLDKNEKILFVNNKPIFLNNTISQLSLSSFLTVLNHHLRLHQTYLELILHNNKIELKQANHSKDNIIKYIFQPKLASILGFIPHKVYKHKNRAHVSPDLFSGNHQFFLYSKHVEPSIVNEVEAKLVRIIPIVNAYFNHYIVKTPIYIPIKTRNDLNFLQFEIRDVAGQLLNLNDMTLIINIYGTFCEK